MPLRVYKYSIFLSIKYLTGTLVLPSSWICEQCTNRQVCRSFSSMHWSCFFEQNICLLVELASHIHGSIFLFSNYMLFPIITILTYIPIKKCMCSFSLHPCKLFSLFDSSCSTCCEVIPLCGFDLYHLVTVFQLDHMCIPVGQHR